MIRPLQCARSSQRAHLPPFGGDALFASMTAAYEGLSTGLKATLLNLNAIHSDGSFAESKVGIDAETSAFRAPTKYPVVIAHPDTGAPCLYVNGDFTVQFEGWSAWESAPLLAMLYAHATRPEYTCALHGKRAASQSGINFWSSIQPVRITLPMRV
jgi:taurine dioxygenase